MVFHLMEQLDELGGAVVHNLAVTDVQLGDFGHILVTEQESPDVDIAARCIPCGPTWG